MFFCYFLVSLRVSSVWCLGQEVVLGVRWDGALVDSVLFFVFPWVRKQKAKKRGALQVRHVAVVADGRRGLRCVAVRS